MSQSKSILMVVTSHGRIDESHPTGVWFDEFAEPYTLFCKAGYAVTVTSPQGGQVPLDPRSVENYSATSENDAARAVLSHTHKLDSRFQASDFDAIFFPGGHGTMFDLPSNPQVSFLLTAFFQADKVVAAVCHGPAAFVGSTVKADVPVIKGRKMTAFSDAEERAVEMDHLMPFLLESTLREQGADVVVSAKWQDHVVVDGMLVTGQNPQSSGRTAEAVLMLLTQGEHNEH